MRFQCVIGGHPLPWSTWDKNGNIVTPSRRFRIMDRDDLRILEIENVTMEDSGLYRITLENEYGRIETTARLDIICNRKRTTRMQRAVSASPRKPYHWTRRLRGNSTAIGGRLALACDVRGKSLPPCKRFYCNGEEIQESDRIKIVREGEGFATQLVIDPVMKSDEGIYMCVAEFASDSDPVVMVCSTEYLKFPKEISEEEEVQPSLVIRKDVQGILVVEEGVEVDLLCEVDSAPGDVFEYVWLKDGMCVPNGEDFQYIDHGNGVIGLRFTDPFLLDSGSYTCRVKSVNGGQVESSGVLQVVEKESTRDQSARPEFVKLPQAVFVRSGSDVTYGCRVMPADAEVMWIVNGVEMNNEMEGVAVSFSKSFGKGTFENTEYERI